MGNVNMLVAGMEVPLHGLHRAVRVLLCLLALVSFARPTDLPGQDIQSVKPGNRIRLIPVDGAEMKGIFLGLGPGGLSLQGSSVSPFIIPVSSIETLELATGHKRMKAAFIGGGIGLLAGAILGGVTSGDCAGDCNDPFDTGGGGLAESRASAEGAILGGLVLGGLGAAAGAIFFAPEKWTKIQLTPGPWSPYPGVDAGWSKAGRSPR